MNLREFLEALKKHFWVLLALIIVLAAAGLIATWRLPQTYEAGSLATAVRTSTTSQSDVNYYLYDDYYSIQSGAFIADNIVSWLASAPSVVSIYESSNVPLPTKNMKALGKIFEAKKLSATSNVVTYKTSNTNPDEGKKLIESANKFISQQVAEINNKQREQGSQFVLNFSDIAVVKAPKAYALNGFLGGLLGLLIGLVYVAYKKSDQTK